MNTGERQRILRDLLEIKRPLREVASELGQVPYDCAPGEELTLTRRQAIRLLDAFVEDNLGREDLEYWARLIENRNDIRYEADSEAIKEMVFVLANPEITRPLDVERAQEWNLALEGELAQQRS
jgi:hypothetical protein